MKKLRVIFLCSRNAARSQMAEAFLRKYAGDHFEVHGVGFEPQPMHQYVIKAVGELGYDLSDQYPKDLQRYLGKIHFRIVITVCAKAKEMCPAMPEVSTRLYWTFEDLVEYQGTEEEKLAKFRDVRNLIHECIKTWPKERGVLMD